MRNLRIYLSLLVASLIGCSAFQLAGPKASTSTSMVQSAPTRVAAPLYLSTTTTTTTTTTSNNNSSISSASKSNTSNNKLHDLNVIIAGAGPSGLLLAHLLLQRGAKVTINESRPDPRVSTAKAALAGFAYALGVGVRGRTAIQRVDSELWQTVKSKGNECDRFRLYVGPFSIKLRDSSVKSKGNIILRWLTGRRNTDNVEPSLLLYQADLCISLMNELERRYGSSSSSSSNNNRVKENTEMEAGNGSGRAGGVELNPEEARNTANQTLSEDEPRFSLNFQSRVVECDLERKRVVLERTRNETVLAPYDLLVGCDGVNSIVRNAIKTASVNFTAEKQTLPGEFKVARLNHTPPKLDPNSVALIIPKSGSCTAFMEPTVNGSACILFAGRGGPDSPILSSYVKPRGEQDNKTAALAEILLECFPLLEGADLEEIAEQLIAQKPGSASSVVCDVYHYNSSVAIAGDAAHATGGVSGQGVNSALLDSVALSDCLEKYFDPTTKESSLEATLLAYSQRQVPEGKALYDLSFGPKPRGLKKVLYSLRAVRDTLFQGRFGIGRPPLQTLLTTSVERFSSIRRKMNFYYDSPFPDSATFDDWITNVHAAMKNTTEEKL